MVCGQRQVGKSTMLNHLKEDNRRYVSFDDRNARRLAHEDPELFFETYGYPILIDEFQKEPTILETIKSIVDKLAYEGKGNNGLFWLTGSQKFEMMKNVSESLAGRITIYDMSSLSSREINGYEGKLFDPSIEALKEEGKKINAVSISDIYERIFMGGMPKIVVDKVEREKYYSNYVETYLERDVRSMEGVGKLDDFYNFLVFMAARTGQELVYDDISRQIGVSANTIKSWISILEKSGIIYMLRPFTLKVSDSLIKRPKVYFMDTGLACYLCRWPNSEILQNGNMDGAILETYVVSELVKSYINAGKSTNNLYYYRDKDKKKIDVLIVEGNDIYPIEIKKSKEPNHPDKNFEVLSKSNMNVKTGIVLCMSDEVIPYNRQCYYVPISLI